MEDRSHIIENVNKLYEYEKRENTIKLIKIDKNIGPEEYQFSRKQSDAHEFERRSQDITKKKERAPSIFSTVRRKKPIPIEDDSLNQKSKKNGRILRFSFF